MADSSIKIKAGSSASGGGISAEILQDKNQRQTWDVFQNLE